MKKYIATILAFLAIAACFYIVSADSTQELQPAYRLMDGKEELGVVYWLDYGMLIMTAEDTIYTCGCGEKCNDTLQEWSATDIPEGDNPSPPARTAVPTDAPPDVPSPTEEPPEEKVRCNKGKGNGGENCDPGNNPDKGNDDE